MYVAFSKGATFTSDVSLDLNKKALLCPRSQLCLNSILEERSSRTPFKDMFTTKTCVSLFLLVGLSSLTKGSLLINYPFHGYG